MAFRVGGDLLPILPVRIKGDGPRSLLPVRHRVSKGAENGDVPSVVIGDEIVWLAREGVAV